MCHTKHKKLQNCVWFFAWFFWFYHWFKWNDLNQSTLTRNSSTFIQTFLCFCNVPQHVGVRLVSGILTPKQLDCTWLCTRVTRAPKVVESCSKARKTRQVLVSAHEKNFFGWGVRIFYEWCHKWRTFRPP